MLLSEASSSSKESKFLPDFYTTHSSSNDFISFATLSGSLDPVIDKVKNAKVPGKKKKEEPPKPAPLTPKEVYTLQMLNDKTFKLNTDPAYVDAQLADFKDKLGLIKSEEYDMRRGVNEISSIVMRLENRKKYAEVRTFFEEFPYTTSSKIDDVIKAHDYLKIGQVAQFMADMPREATEVMKNYNKFTDKVCGKQAVFYIIADKKDFEKVNKRRDPILLAQSPFAHVWQIIGAWDREMLFLEEL